MIQKKDVLYLLAFRIAMLGIVFFVNSTVFSLQSYAHTPGKTEKGPLESDDRYINADTVRSYTEEQVIELALVNSRKLKSLHTNVEIANYRLESSGGVENPELRLSDISTRYYTDEFDELRVGLRWHFPKIGELGEKKQRANVNLWERKINEIRYRQALIAKVRNNYATVIMYDQLVDLAKKRIALEEKRIGIIEQMVDLGIRSVVYQTKARMWHSESKNDYTRTVQKQSLARRKLAKQSGLSENISFVPVELPEVSQSLDELINMAYDNRPEIDLVEERIELAVRQNKLESRKLIPWPTYIDLSYHREKERKEDWGECRLGIKLPLFNWNRGNIKATNLAVKKKEDEFDTIKESIGDEVRDAYSRYMDLLLDYQTFSWDTRELIEMTNELVKKAQKHETLQPDEVLEMELSAIEAQKLLVEKRCNLCLELIELDFVLGIEKEKTLPDREEH